MFTSAAVDLHQSTPRLPNSYSFILSVSVGLLSKIAPLTLTPLKQASLSVTIALCDPLSLSDFQRHVDFA